MKLLKHENSPCDAIKCERTCIYQKASKLLGKRQAFEIVNCESVMSKAEIMLKELNVKVVEENKIKKLYFVQIYPRYFA